MNKDDQYTRLLLMPPRKISRRTPTKIIMLSLELIWYTKKQLIPK
jgi:hypothetical protein